MPVPWITEDDLIYLCSSQCTLCGSILFQKHHIDGNNTNNDPDNWTILCQPHHDMANRDLQVNGTHTRKYSRDMLKKMRYIHIQSHFFNRFGDSVINTGEITENTEEIEKVENAETKSLLKRTREWLSQE